MSEESHHKGALASLGLLGAIATIVSVWRFALRPRRHSQEDEVR